MKGVMTFERELLEHIDMLKLAKEENDSELESETLKALIDMRRVSKEKELEALLSADNDPCSCYIEVTLEDNMYEIVLSLTSYYKAGRFVE
jgi:peptide chain release factor 2